LIVEVGPKDLDKNSVMFRNRIKINQDGWKNFEGFDEFVKSINDKLTTIQKEMLALAQKRLNDNVVTNINTAKDFEAYFANSNVYLDGKAPKVAFVKGKWCGDPATEEKMKEMRISIRCIPFEQSGTKGECLLSGKEATLDVIYARSY
jgi:prolyl-tRNA synthetase